MTADRKFVGGRRRTRFTMTPTWIGPALDRNRRANGLALYGVIAGYVDQETGEAWPSRKRLGDAIGKSDDTVDRALAALVDAGALERIGQVRRRSGGWSTSRYLVHFDAPD